MEKGVEVNTKPSRFLRPVYITAALLLILAVNAVVFLKSKNETTIADEDETSVQQSIAAEYSLTDNNTVYDLTLDK